MTARVTFDDLALAREFIFKSTNTGNWNKPHWQAAAFAMAWFIRELPGSPLLMNRVLKLMESHPDATIAMSEATSLIRAQSLDASILPNTGPPTSTQAPLGAGRLLEEVLEEDLDLNESPITSGRPPQPLSTGTALTSAPSRPAALAATTAVTTTTTSTLQVGPLCYVRMNWIEVKSLSKYILT